MEPFAVLSLHAQIIDLSLLGGRLPNRLFLRCGASYVVFAALGTFERFIRISPFRRWYSCMLGKKCSLAPLKEELRKQGVSARR